MRPTEPPKQACDETISLGFLNSSAIGLLSLLMTITFLSICTNLCRLIYLMLFIMTTNFSQNNIAILDVQIREWHMRPSYPIKKLFAICALRIWMKNYLVDSSTTNCIWPDNMPILITIERLLASWNSSSIPSYSVEGSSPSLSVPLLLEVGTRFDTLIMGWR